MGTLRRPSVVARLRRVPVVHPLPTILSGSEVQRLFAATRSAKYRALFSLLYGAGLRLQEALELRVEDIDSPRMMLRIRCSKSRPRDVPMSERVLRALREYWRQERPGGPLLFPGQRNPARPLTQGAVTVKCFHVVFTLPAQLRPLARRHGRHLYELLLRSASSTLLTLGRDRRWLGAELGITAVLHTWARDLSLHPHAHCIVTAGGLSLDDSRWVDAQHGFLFPVAVLARLVRGRFLAGLRGLRRTCGVGRHLNADAFDSLLRLLYATDWNVYCKAPFAGPQQIFR